MDVPKSRCSGTEVGGREGSPGGRDMSGDVNYIGTNEKKGWAP